MLAPEEAVVGGEHDHRVLEAPARLQDVEERLHRVVDRQERPVLLATERVDHMLLAFRE